MKTAIVSSSQISAFGRMDAAFHLAVADTKEQVKKLEAKYEASEVVARLQALPTEDLAALEPLLTGQKQTSNRKALLAAIDAYPFIAFALVQAEVEATMKKAQADADAAMLRVANLAAIKAT